MNKIPFPFQKQKAKGEGRTRVHRFALRSGGSIFFSTFMALAELEAREHVRMAMEFGRNPEPGGYSN